MRSIVMLVIAGILSVQLLVPAQTTARPVYKAYKVEFPTYAHPRKLNNLRQVMITPPSNQAPLVWFNGTLTSLPGFDTTGYSTYYATGINDSGYLCAYGTYTDFSGSITDPFFWTGAAVKLNENPIGITNPPSPDPYGYVFDVNNRNDIVGQLPADSGWARAVIWFGGNGQAVVIGTLDQYQESWGRAVNESGQVACDADQPVPAGIASNRAFVWDNGAKTTLEPLDGNTINNTWALDINSSGWVVGRSALYDSTHSEIRATLWRNGTPVDLIGGPITNGQTVATAINDSGMIILSSNGYNGRLWYNDSLWLLDSLVENTLYDDGTLVPSVDAPLDINEHGDIITGEGSLLVLQTPGLIVNSEGDADDNDLSDGVCYTGGVNSLGEDECTLRAAIEQANFNAGRDTIKFDIPTNSVPKIAPTSSLPPITGSVDIDARTQPVFKKVEVDGSNAPTFARSGEAAVDGLAVTTDSVEIRGMIIDGFSGNGLNLQSGVGHVIESNTFGGDSTKPNQLNGILISGADSVAIGDDYAQANTITYNNGAGISITSGEGNTISRNIIHDNGGLGIDLGGDGVTKNDSLDADSGPNKLVNYPLIDSASITGGFTHLYGHINGAPFNAHKIEIFFNSKKDSSGYGEGEQSMWTSTANTDASGYGEFQTTFSPELPSDQFITMTATDQDGNTSEFSPDWPSKIFRLVNNYAQEFAFRKFTMSRVISGKPTFDTLFVDTITTDYLGEFDASDYIRSGQLHLGDTLMFSQLMKSSDTTADSSYSVHLDNAKFDSLTYEMYFDTLSPEPIQQVMINHSTFAYNLNIGVTWDASTNYLYQLQLAVRKVSNYLYDISDGQIRLDTVLIQDNALGQVIVSHNLTPTRPFMLLRRTNEGHFFFGRNPYLPRRWFMPGSSFPDSSANDYPVSLALPVNYRFWAKELMHTFLGLEDEITAPLGACPYRTDMGFMGWPYGGPGMEDPGSSEMSWSDNYSSTDCRSTAQWRTHVESCWDWVEERLEATYGSDLSPVIKPDERYLPPGNRYFDGPNNDLDHPDYDVGALVVFPNTPTAPATSDNPSSLSTPEGGSLSYTDVYTSTTVNIPGYGPRHFFVHQGKTSGTDGEIVLLGLLPNDSIKANGKIVHYFGKSGRGRSAAAAADFSWAYGAWQLGSALPDTLSFTASEVTGSYPLVCGAALSGSDLTVQLYSAAGFQSLPTLDYMTDVDTMAQRSFAQNASGYATTLANYSASDQTLEVHAPDDLDSIFFFDNQYGEVQFSDTLPAYLVDGHTGVSFVLDSMTFATKAGILSSPYPVIRSGLDTVDYAVSETHALALLPTQSSLPGANQITIDYDLYQVPDSERTAALKSSIRIFHFNESTLQWELVGGDVDTTASQVTAVITKPGVYAAFSTDVATDVNEPSGGTDLPSKFALEQNYPNPFNPTTTIEFELPRASHVELTIFNIVGQRVRQLVNETMSAGTHRVVWDGKGPNGTTVSSGVYFYQISTDRNTEAKKMLLLK